MTTKLDVMVRCSATLATPLDMNKFYNYSVQILLANLDKISQYKPIRSACKLLKSCAKHLSIRDWGRAILVISYLQALVSHKNLTLAKAAQGAYVSLLVCYRDCALMETASGESFSSVPGSITAFLINSQPRGALSPNQLSFRLKCLSILMPVYEKQQSTHESVPIISWTVKEIVHLIAEISDVPMPPKAYCLPDLIESATNVLAIYPSSQLMEELWRSLKLAIIGCFEAYPRLSQNVTERIAYSIFNAIKILTNERYLTSVINEAFYHAVLQTCSHSPFDLEDSELDSESEVEKEVVEGELDSVKQPSGFLQTEIKIPRPSYREYLPLWRTLLGLPTGLVRKERYARTNTESLFPIFRLLLTSSVAILKRLDFTYVERSTDVGEMESQVVVNNPQDVLLLSNMAAFLERILPDCSIAACDATVPSFLQTSLELVEKYPLLSGLYRLLRLAVLLAKQSGLFEECYASPTLTHLSSFAIALLEALQPMEALSADDLSTARCSCLLILPLSVFSLHLEDELFDKFAHVISFTCQLAGLQVRCADLAIAAVTAVESWLNEVKSNSSIYSTAFGSLVPALTGLLGVQQNKPITEKALLSPIGQRSQRSSHRAKIRHTLRAIARRPIRLNFDSTLVSTSVSRQARVSAAEYLHGYIVFGLVKQREMVPDPSDPIGESDSEYWSLLFHVAFILGADTDQKVLLRILNLTPPEDDICGFIDSQWPLPELIQTRRTKLASACFQDFLKWMSSEATGNKRRNSIGDQTFEDLLQLNLDGLCQDGAAAQVFTDTIANLLSVRPEMAIRYVFLLIDAFKQSLLSAPNQSSISAAVKRAVGLLTELMKKLPEDLICDSCASPEKQPRLTRIAKNKLGVEPLKPASWEAASVPSCLKSLLLACRDPFNGKLFQELVKQVISSSSLQIIPKILPDTASLISTFEWKLDSLSGFVRCLDNYAWLLSASLITNTLFFEAIQLPESRIIANTLDSSEKLAETVQAAFAISSCLNYQIAFDAEVLLKAISQSNVCLICPSNLLTILEFDKEDAVQLNNPNAIVSILLKSLSIYSREPNKMRTSQLCDGLANIWHQCIEPFLKDSNFIKDGCADLLEAVISLSQVELDRNTYAATYMNLLTTETLKPSTKVKLLDMLAFFLQPEVIPTTFGLTSERRIEIVEAVKLLLASNLPLDPQEFARPSAKLSECGTLLRSVLSLLKTVSCPEAIQILTMTFCRYDEHFMDEELNEALRCAMKQIWAQPLVQERLLTSALEDFERAVISGQLSVAFIDLWHRYFHKFVKPLLLYVGPTALERIGVRNIVKWTQNLETGVQGGGLTVTHWMWRLLNCSATFYLLVVLYNRLPKTCLHGMNSGGVGSILKAFLGPVMHDPLRKMEINGKELTTMLIGKAYATLKDTLEPPLNASLTHNFEATASTLRRALWSASLACLVATVSATQTQEKFYNCALACDPLSRFLPAGKKLNFPRRRSGKYRSAFIELREEFWLPSQSEPYLRRQSKESVEKGRVFGSDPNRGELLQGSSFSVEINRFMRASGTQIIRGSSSLTDLKKPIRSMEESTSPSPSTTSADPVQYEGAGAAQVNLEIDCLNTTSVMVCFVGLLNQMHRLGFLKAKNPNEMPAILRFLLEQFNSSRSNANVRAFVVKVIINCTELFKPFAKLWLPILITYASSGVEALVDSCGLSSLCIDLCLLLGDWGVSGDSLPSSEIEQSAARSLLAYLMKNTWIPYSPDADGDQTSSIPEGVASALKNNLELFRLLTETWLPAGVAIPYKELLFELQGHDDYKRVTFSFHLFKIILSSCDSFSPDADNIPLSQFISALLKHVHQRHKTLLTVVWECSGLLASKFISLCSTSQDRSGDILQSRGLHILPLSHFPTDLHPLVIELWSSVNDLNIAQRHRRPSEGPITSTIEAACAAAHHWPMLAIHLTNTLLGMGIPESIESATFSHCLRMFGKLMVDFKEDKLVSSLEQTAKIEILQNVVNSNVLEMLKWGTEIVLFDGTMLILRMIQFAIVLSQGDKEFSAEMRQVLILRLLQTLMSTLTRPNSTSNSRRIAYRTFVEARQAVGGMGNKEIEEVCNLGLSFGLCTEDDQRLRGQLQKHISQHCLNSLPFGGSPSLSRCLSVLQLLSSGCHENEADQALAGRIGQHLVSTILEMALEPAIKSAEFRHPFRQNPLDPHFPFKETSFTRTSISTSRFMLDPVVLSGTQQLLQSRTQVAEAGSATLVLAEGSSTGTHLMETQGTSSTFTFSQTNQMFPDSSSSRGLSFFSSNSTQIRQRNKFQSFENLSRVERLRRKFVFPSTIAFQSPETHMGDGFREFFKQRTIQRQHAETTLTLDTSLNDSARLCRRHRLGALPDVETLTPEALLKPLFQLAAADPSGCGSVLLGLMFEAVIASTAKSTSGDSFLKGLGSALAGLLLRGQSVCLSLLWELSGLEGGVFYLLPEPTLLAASAISAGLTAIGTLVMEEAFCAAAMRRSKGIRQSLSTPSPWTAATRRFFTSSLPVFILPHEEFGIASAEGTNNHFPTTATAATCWWQLTRLYADMGLSDELLGWLCDRWITGSKSPVLLERLGTAIVAKMFGDHEDAFMQLSVLLTSSTDDGDGDYEDKIRESEDEETESNIWSTCPAGLDVELQLFCREELLQCLARLGSWGDLDVAAIATATSLIASTDALSPTAAGAKPSTSNATVVDEFSPLWKDPYLVDSVVPQIIHSRLQQCLLAEINKVIAISSSSDADALNRFCRVMESGLRSASQDFETKFAYELAVFSVLCGDLSRAQLCCKSAFKGLAQTWSSKECRNTLLQKTQLLIELKEFLEVSTKGALLYLVAAECLSLNDWLLPVVVDFRLECSNEFSRTGNARRAINQLTSLYELIQMLDRVGHDSEYRRLAWCSAFSRAWISAYPQDIVLCSDAAAVSSNLSTDLENGLLRCLSSNCHCIEVYEALRQLPSTDNDDAVLVQFSHAFSMGQILSAFHDFQTSGRLSDLGLRHYMTSLQPTLKTRFSQIHGLGEVDDVNFLQSSAFSFFKRCVEMAMGVWSTLKGSSPLAEKAIYRRNLLAYGPDEALLEVANFCNARIDEEGERNRDAYAGTFTRSVLTAMRMGAEGGRIRFGRVLQIEVARCNSTAHYDSDVFYELTKCLPPWMFFQWLDRLLNALLEGAARLVADILRRVAQRYSQVLALPFRVLLTSVCDWEHDEQPLVERFTAKLIENGNGDALPIFTELLRMFSKHVRLSRLLSELEYLDDPDIVFKDWASNYARKSIASDFSNRANLMASCNSLLKHGFLRLHGAVKSSTSSNAGIGRQCASEKLLDLVRKEFGHDCKALQNITLSDFDSAIQRIVSMFKQNDPKVSRLDHFSQWLVNFSPDEQDPVGMLGQCVNFSSERQVDITVERVDPNVKCLASLRRPKLVRLLGNDGRWRSWLVKGGEDLRQDASIQRLLGFANYAIASATAATSSGVSAEPLCTYAVVPVSSSRGLIRWLNNTTTLFTFIKNAMAVRETERYSTESNELAAKAARHSGDFLWDSESEAASLVLHFAELEDFIFSLRLLRRGLRNSVATSAEHFVTLRHRLISSHAAICAVHFILGVGDRHMGNFLLDTTTGSLIGIDFGYAFGVTLSFPMPEYVPIRLTASLRELLEPSGPAGLFGSTLYRTLAALRHHSSLFLSTIQTFIEDSSSTDWSVYSERYDQSGEEYQRCRLSLLRRKLIGHCPAELLIDDLRGRFGKSDWFTHFEMIARTTVASTGGPVVLSPAEQVRRLVCLSTCPELLARMHAGWSAAL
ncbi:DNA-dependent protein kinase catalytic subunit [Taenia crassiceps]|uniref:DNA-dependent protein kinase catalytic subunit n=1 Tax=Taenia crassiceps TaxID=6207 RepID=A0ABR4Q5Q3_9CEST